MASGRRYSSPEIAEFIPVWENAIAEGSIAKIESLRPRYLEIFSKQLLSDDIDCALNMNQEDIADYFIQWGIKEGKSEEIQDALDRNLESDACSMGNLKNVKFLLSRGAGSDPVKMKEYIQMARGAGFHDIVKELEARLN